MDNEVSHIFRAVVVRGRILSFALTCGLLDPTLSSKGWGMRRPFVQTVSSSSLANVDTQNLLRRFLDLRKPPQSVDTQ